MTSSKNGEKIKKRLLEEIEKKIVEKEQMINLIKFEKPL